MKEQEGILVLYQTRSCIEITELSADPVFNLRHLQTAIFWLTNPGRRSLFESGLGSTLMYYVTCFSEFLCSGINISTKGHFIGHEARLRAGPVLKHSAPPPPTFTSTNAEHFCYVAKWSLFSLKFKHTDMKVRRTLAVRLWGQPDHMTFIPGVAGENSEIFRNASKCGHWSNRNDLASNMCTKFFSFLSNPCGQDVHNRHNVLQPYGSVSWPWNLSIIFHGPLQQNGNVFFLVAHSWVQSRLSG